MSAGRYSESCAWDGPGSQKSAQGKLAGSALYRCLKGINSLLAAWQNDNIPVLWAKVSGLPHPKVTGERLSPQSRALHRRLKQHPLAHMHRRGARGPARGRDAGSCCRRAHGCDACKCADGCWSGRHAVQPIARSSVASMADDDVLVYAVTCRAKGVRQMSAKANRV